MTAPSPPQSASRGATVLNVLKVLPRALAGVLCRSGLLPWLVPFCHLATRSLRDVVDGLTANPELQAVLCYIFPTYGRSPGEAMLKLFRDEGGIVLGSEKPLEVTESNRSPNAGHVSR